MSGSTTAAVARHTVGDVARLAGVSVRTLHHYDDIGLLRPTARTDAGYRVYVREDLDRLHAILAYRELGFDLGAIGGMLDKDADPVAHLERQLALLTRRAQRLEAPRAHLTKVLEAHKMGIQLDPQAMLEVFGDHDPSRHAEEAEQRWGDTEAYAESRRRASGYGKEDWIRMRDEMIAIEDRFIAAMVDGVPASDPRAMDVAEAHRDHVRRWFYDCGHAMHVGLADMYVADPRFTAHYDERAEGLAAYVASAIRANAARAGHTG